ELLAAGLRVEGEAAGRITAGEGKTRLDHVLDRDRATVAGWGEDDRPPEGNRCLRCLAARRGERRAVDPIAEICPDHDPLAAVAEEAEVLLRLVAGELVDERQRPAPAVEGVGVGGEDGDPAV